MKIGRRIKKGICRHSRNYIVQFWSRRYRDGKGEYLLCPECKGRVR